MKLSAILLSGGKGKRMGVYTPKQYLPLGGKPIAHYSFATIRSSPEVSEIIVVCDTDHERLFPSARFARPGLRRQDSVFHGLAQVSLTTEMILIHDIARPFLSEDDLHNVIVAAQIYGAATLAIPVKATIKRADKNLMVTETPDRETLFDIQTPQVIRKEILLQGFAKAQAKKITVTDDVSLAELISHPVKLVTGSYDNIKITTPEDLTLAENILREKALQV